MKTEQETEKPQHLQRQLPVGFLVSAAQNEKKKSEKKKNHHVCKIFINLRINYLLKEP